MIEERSKFYIAEYVEKGLGKIISTYDTEAAAIVALKELDSGHAFSVELNPFSMGKTDIWVACEIWPDENCYYSCGATPEEALNDYLENWR